MQSMDMNRHTNRPMRVFLGVLLGVSFSLSVPSLCAAADHNSFLIGLNVLSHGLNRVSKEPSGATSALGTSYYNLDFQYHYEYAGGVFFSPRITVMPDFLLPAKSPDGALKTTFLILGLPVTYNMGSSWDLNAGLALILYQLSGSGGTTTLSNGNTTSNFALPGRNESSKTVGLLLGTSYHYESYRLQFDTMTEGLLSNSKRTFSLMLTASYIFR